MKRSIVLITLLSLPIHNLKAAEDYSGSRIGVGYGTTIIEKLSTHLFDYGDGAKFEYGYDINRIFGLKVAYELNQESSVNLQGESVKFGTDIGYAINVSRWDIKPYAFIGVAQYSETRDAISDERLSSSNTTPVFGMGVRANLDSGLYVDLNLDMMEMDTNIAGQSALTLGYKF